MAKKPNLNEAGVENLKLEILRLKKYIIELQKYYKKQKLQNKLRQQKYRNKNKEN